MYRDYVRMIYGCVGIQGLRGGSLGSAAPIQNVQTFCLGK